MNDALFFDDLKVGKSWTSRARTVTESDIVNFACHTGDFDPLHTDHVFAKETPFGRPIAHGLLGLSWVAGLASVYPMVNTLAFLSVRDWEFQRPIHIGDTLRVVNEVIELTPKGRKRGLVRWRRKLVNQAAEVVQIGVFETLVARRSPAPRATRGGSETPKSPKREPRKTANPK